MKSAEPMGLSIEDVVDDEIPALEQQDSEMPALEGTGEEGSTTETSQTRAEKKSRKAFSKLGLKVFPGVRKVTIKQTQILFVIQKPEVFKLGNSYIIFGKVSYKELGGKKGGMEDLKENLTNTQQSGVEEEIPVFRRCWTKNWRNWYGW